MIFTIVKLLYTILDMHHISIELWYQKWTLIEQLTVGDIGTPVCAYWFKKNKAKQQQQKMYESG